ncbi:hypothetical protein INT47_003821 [Mucor saturninus]|uniref:Uncharacterized protein n=1 Tax=Mucor saturninus TaxID=64648 RepID=A0A8H7UWA8_9FUNG|nr:hypothetical protein INT47_003821 [Mucor saturninus]
MSNNNNKKVPQWSLQLTEKLMSPSISSSAIIMHHPQDKQFENYLDRQFTSDDATLLKNRLSETPSKKPSEATTLRNSSGTAKYPTIVPKGGNPQEDEEANPWWLTKNDTDGFYSLPGVFFLLGFIFPPFWWIGSLWPRHVREKGGKMAERWQKLNRIMSIGFSSILVILVIVFAVLYATGNM